MGGKAEKKTLNALSPEFVLWKVVGSQGRGKTQRSRTISKVKDEVKFQVYLNHFYDVESVPFDILVDVPAGNCINCLGPRHFKCDKPQSHDYCFNCGRSGVRVTTCPRCRRAYPAYLERRKKSGFGRDAGKAIVNEVQKKPKEPIVSKVVSTPPVIMDTQEYPLPPIVKETASWSSTVKSSLKIPNIQLVNNTDFSWHNECLIESQKNFEITNDYLQDLTNLMERIQCLPILDQNSIVLQFISERQKLLEQKNMSDQNEKLKLQSLLNSNIDNEKLYS